MPIRTAANNTYEAVIDLASVERCWPVGHQVPQLIIDMAYLIAPWGNPIVGYANIKGSRFDDYWIELGGDLSERFGNFISLPDGSRIAMWFHEGAVIGAEPIVEFSNDGDLNVLAPNLKSFMTKWAEGTVQQELDPEPKYFLQRQVYSEKMLAMIDAAPDHPVSAPIGNLPKFLEQWRVKALDKIASDTTMQQILKLLDTHVPKRPTGSDPEITYVAPTSYQIRIAGARVEIQPPAIAPEYTTFEPLPEKDALIELLLTSRETRAREVPGRGLWHDATLQIYEEKYVLLKASWEFEPGFREGGRMTKAELDADLKRFPRDPRWRQPWMDELL
jgi:hypothetical protein